MGIMANIEEYSEELMGWHRRYPPFDVFGATVVKERASEGEQMFQSLNPNRYLMVKLWHKTGNHHCRIAELNGDLKIIRRFLHSRLRTAEKQFCKFRLGSRSYRSFPQLSSGFAQPSVKVMRYPHKSYGIRLESAEERRDRNWQDQALTKENSDEDDRR